MPYKIFFSYRLSVGMFGVIILTKINLITKKPTFIFYNPACAENYYSD